MEQPKAWSPLSESERKNVEQLLPECLHIKEEPEMLSEGQEEKQLCVEQETNSAACSVKDEEENPQTSQLHCRQPTEMNIKEEPTTCTLNELMKIQTVGMNSKGPEAAQNPHLSSLVLQSPDGTEIQTDYSSEDDEGCWQKPLSESETESDSTRNNADMGCNASRTRINLFQQICSKKKVLVKKTSECVAGKEASLCVASKLKIHTGEKPFECDVCRKCFTRKGSLQAHMRTHTGEKRFKCDVCSKCFIEKHHLKSHVRIHTGEKPFKCDICSKYFNNKVDMKRHIRIHTGEKPYKCEFCSKCFYYKVDIKRHMRIHTGEKPFKCDVCRKCFTRKGSLQEHMRIHTGQKPFKCDVCSKCFILKHHLNAHVRIHTGEKPFKCDVCSKCFIQKHHLQSHIRIHTGEKHSNMMFDQGSVSNKSELKVHQSPHIKNDFQM